MTEPTLDEINGTLLWLLRRAGDEWGPLGVAKAAALLVGHGAEVVLPPGPPPVDGEVRLADTVPVDRDLLRAVRMAFDPSEERPNWARCLDLLDHLPDPDQP